MLPFWWLFTLLLNTYFIYLSRDVDIFCATYSDLSFVVRRRCGIGGTRTTVLVAGGICEHSVILLEPQSVFGWHRHQQQKAACVCVCENVCPLCVCVLVWHCVHEAKGRLYPPKLCSELGNCLRLPDGAGWVYAWINIAMFMPPSTPSPNTLIKSNLEEERTGKKEGEYGMCQGFLCSLSISLLLKESAGTEWGNWGRVMDRAANAYENRTWPAMTRIMAPAAVPTKNTVDAYALWPYDSISQPWWLFIHVWTAPTLSQLTLMPYSLCVRYIVVILFSHKLFN